MHKTQYSLISSTVKTENGTSAKTYGIKVNYSGAVIYDISCDKRIVEDLIRRLDNEILEPDQLMYIIEDSII